MRAVHAHRDLPDVVTDDADVQDFAFADTVVAGFEDPGPSSGIVLKRSGSAHCVTPLPQPAVYPDPSTSGRRGLGAIWARVRHDVRISRAEVTELWSAAASLETVDDGHDAVLEADAPLARAAAVGRRVRTFFSFFEWDRADVLKAAWLGLIVFVLAATAGALVLRATSHEAPPATTVPHTTAR